MIDIFVNLGPRPGGELLHTTPFRGFIRVTTTSYKDRGRKTLKLYFAGRMVGKAIFRWHTTILEEQLGKDYLKARGGLDDLHMDVHHSDQLVYDMIKEAMEEEGWEFYLYDPEDRNSWEAEKFEEWILQQLRK